MLTHFQIGSLDAAGWREARLLPLADFEDAVVGLRWQKVTASAFIITRNAGDFAGSPVPAISLADFLSRFTHQDMGGPSQ
ncbi:MAG: hypothetical protein NTV08_17100 [Verrucomicrobia bacterium]|nr:hypothetical protein [Verrucomicrobiota bacterium]